MDDADIAYQIDDCAAWPFAFTLDDVIARADSELSATALSESLRKDERFVRLSDHGQPDHYITATALFNWYMRLHLRLAQAKRPYLSHSPFADVFSALRLDGRWSQAPKQAIEWGRELGLAACRSARHSVRFPLVHMLSYMDPALRVHAVRVLASLVVGSAWSPISLNAIAHAIREGVSQFPRRTIDVVTEREGLLTGQPRTLEQIGDCQGVTRERIRQIEAKFYWALGHGRGRGSRRVGLLYPFLRATIYAWVKQRSDLLGPGVIPTEVDRAHLKFLAKCLDIPCAQPPWLHTIMLGVTDDVLIDLTDTCPLSRCTDVEYVTTRLSAAFPPGEARCLARAYVQHRLLHLNKAQRVYVVLRKIGRPAHYTSIVHEYLGMFPNDTDASEHNIHAVLLREQHGVVLIGARGTFALEEWGYKRPARGLFQAVEQIIKERYAQSGQPVPMQVIMAEVAKERGIAKPASVAFAARLNPTIKPVQGDRFVPVVEERGVGAEGAQGLSPEELDNVLQDFDRE